MVAAGVAAALTLIEVDARAQSGGFFGGGATALAVWVGLDLTAFLVAGFVTEGMVIHDLIQGHGVRRGAAVYSTIVWSVVSAGMVVATVFAVGPSSGENGGARAAVIAGDAVAFSALGVAIYGLTRPRRTQGGSRRSVGLLPHPTAISTPEGLAPGIGLSFSM